MTEIKEFLVTEIFGGTEVLVAPTEIVDHLITPNGGVHVLLPLEQNMTGTVGHLLYPGQGDPVHLFDQHIVILTERPGDHVQDPLRDHLMSFLPEATLAIIE